MQQRLKSRRELRATDLETANMLEQIRRTKGYERVKPNPFVRWSLALTFASTALLGSYRPARGLPEAEVTEILRNVPVFVLADNRNKLVLSSRPGSTDFQIRFYVSATAAQAALTRLQQNRPDDAARVRVAPLPMSEAYNLAKSQRVLPNSPSFLFVPDLDQVEEAREILAAQGEETRLGDVPLFVATAPDGSYLPLGKGEDQRIPFFFDRDQLEERLGELRKESPDAADAVTISVVPLGNVISTLLASDDEQLRLVYLFPSREALNFQRSLR